SSLLLLGFQLVQQVVEALEVGLPDLTDPLQPFRGLGERLGIDPARPALGVAATRDQARALQNAQVLGDSGLAHCERLSQLHHRCFTRREPIKDRASGRIGQGREGPAEAFGRVHSTTYWFYNSMVIYTTAACLSRH